jgi:hypothetical protein
MSFSEDWAKESVLKHVNNIYGKSSGIHSEREIVIVKTICYQSDGWIFFYDTQEAVDTGEWIDGLVGNYPIFVFKDNGNMYSIYPDTDEEAIIRRHREKYHSPCPDCCSQTDIEKQPQNQAA